MHEALHEQDVLLVVLLTLLFTFAQGDFDVAKSRLDVHKCVAFNGALAHTE